MRKSNNRRRKPAAVRNSQASPYSIRFLLIGAVCGCILAVGFFFAARQHFTSMDFGIKNSRLRKQLEDLESENRRLLLAREIAFSPSEIKKSARNKGLREVGFENISIAAVTETKTKNITTPIENIKSAKTADEKPAVQLTAFQKPAIVSRPEVPVKAEKAEKKVSSIPTKDKEKKNDIVTIASLR
jgi:hypothetical protein